MTPGTQMTPDPELPHRMARARRAFIIVLGVLGLVFLLLLRPVFIPLFLATILAISLYPIYQFFLKRTRFPRYVASAVSTFLIFLMLVLPFGFVLALVVNQLADFLASVDIRQFVESFASQQAYQIYVQPLVEVVEKRLHLSIDVAGLLAPFGATVASQLYQISPQVLGRTASFIFGFFVMHVSLFFLFVEGKNVVRVLMDLSPLPAVYESRLAQEFRNMIHATVYGYLLTAFVQAVLAGIGFWIAGIKSPVVFGALTFFMCLVPIVGSAAVWLPATLWLFVTGHWGYGVFMLLYGIFVISGVDNVIKPWIMKGKANIHVLLIFFSILGGLSLFGPIGILFGPVITSLFLACVRIYREDFIDTPSRQEG